MIDKLFYLFGGKCGNVGQQFVFFHYNASSFQAVRTSVRKIIILKTLYSLEIEITN